MSTDEGNPSIVTEMDVKPPLEVPPPGVTATSLGSPPSLPPSTNEDDDESDIDDSTLFGANEDMHRDGSSSLGSSSKLGDPRNGGGGVEQTPEKGQNHILKLITRQAEAVYSTRTLVSLILLGLAVGFAFAFYFLVLREEKKEFKKEFDEFGLSVLKNALSNTYQIFAELDSIGVYITSMALHASVQFQLASTLNNFGRITQRTFNILPVEVINYSPIVQKENRPAWEAFAANRTMSSSSSLSSTFSSENGGMSGIIYNGGGPIPQDAPGPFVPLWHTSSIDLSYEERVSQRYNFDLLSYAEFRRAFQWMLHYRHGVISEPITDRDALFVFTGIQYTPDMLLEPYSFVLQPVFDGLGVGQHEVAGVVTALVPLSFILQKSRGGNSAFVTILHDSCGNHAYTYDHHGSKTSYLGPSQLHDRQFDAWAVSMDDKTVVTSLVSDAAGHATNEVSDSDQLSDGTKDCPFRLSVYPTTKFRDEYLTHLPWIVFGVVVAIFICMGCLFARYDILLTRRQTSLMNHALRTTHIIESLFPSNVHQRMFETSRDAEKIPGTIKNSRKGSDVARVMDALNGGKETYDDGGDGDHAVVNGMYTTKPIADLFPHTTIMFADIVGFTAWSSQREPTQVFALLETLFRAFDKIAKRLNVFKVETIGDCYVAVAGLPHPRDDHAVVMAIFCKECMERMIFLVRHLEVTLGPDTGDLSMRFGLHSGPVTAGVLRGEKSRFQLFGDSVNTAARIETTGARGKIHMSHETAELLISAGHSKWVAPRPDLVTAKGKGVLRTYWLVTGEESEGAHREDALKSADFSLDKDEESHPSSRDLVGLLQEGTEKANTWGNTALAARSANRLVDWNVDVLRTLLKNVLRKRRNDEKRKTTSTPEDGPMGRKFRPSLAVFSSSTEHPKVEVEEEEIELSPQVESELRAYVTLMANMYRNHPFHNFAHASHVMLSIHVMLSKLMSRIAAPKLDDIDDNDDEVLRETLLHEYTLGIATDPLLQFAIAFAALIHDVDHPGVPNVILMKEDTNLAKKYRNKSVAEKHSIRLSWERLMDSDFHEFRQCLCPTQAELKRFRNFVVNTVMATDIADKQLNGKRKERWSQCFDQWPEDPSQDDIQRKATIVVEHLIQASDVAHTMQHFEVFKKWNKKLFLEMYQAYEDGRSDTDPSLKWYEGEIGFFDFYIIPLAKKLGACGVFGVSSEEYLQYAQENRNQWEKQGRSYVDEWVQFRKDLKERKGGGGNTT